MCLVYTRWTAVYVLPKTLLLRMKVAYLVSAITIDMVTISGIQTIQRGAECCWAKQMMDVEDSGKRCVSVGRKNGPSKARIVPMLSMDIDQWPRDKLLERRRLCGIQFLLVLPILLPTIEEADSERERKIRVLDHRRIAAKPADKATCGGHRRLERLLYIVVALEEFMPFGCCGSDK